MREGSYNMVVVHSRIIIGSEEKKCRFYSFFQLGFDMSIGDLRVLVVILISVGTFFIGLRVSLDQMGFKETIFSSSTPT